MKRSHVFLIIMLVLLGVGGWYLWHIKPNTGMKDTPSEANKNAVSQDGSGKTILYWYDPMVPDQKFDKPGKSPFMDMQLVPKYATENGEDSKVSISAITQQNLGIRVVTVTHNNFGGQITTVGRIQPDERQYFAVQTRVPGFVERLFVRAIGDPVSKGQKVAEVYAPDLLAAQQEYLTLLDLDYLAEGDALKNAARGRLKLLGMSEGEIASISRNRHTSPRFGIYAPESGVVTELGVREGGQLMAGTSLMQISDLSKVWLLAELPERDTARVTTGMKAEARLQGMPNQVLTGKVGYLYPTLDETTRTLRIRIELPNPGLKLRPGMYADVSLAGDKREALAVPSESVIATGKRQVVIVREDNGFRPAEVTTGQQQDGLTEILAGLHEGESVVASGQFLIDSEASLSGVLARLAQKEPSSDMATMSMPDSKSGTAKTPHGTGKIVNFDAAAGEITLAHDPIAELGWPSMTMGFKLKDAGQLQGLHKDDRVQFDLQLTDQDEYLISHIEKAGMSNGMKKGGQP